MGHDFCETPCDGCLSTVLDRLADLIDPGDMLQSRRDNVACDRGALLTIADELDGFGRDGGDGFGLVLSRAGCATYAACIREALGVGK